MTQRFMYSNVAHHTADNALRQRLGSLQYMAVGLWDHVVDPECSRWFLVSSSGEGREGHILDVLVGLGSFESIRPRTPATYNEGLLNPHQDAGMITKFILQPYRNLCPSQ
jgi:hypothetical protein